MSSVWVEILFSMSAAVYCNSTNSRTGLYALPRSSTVLVRIPSVKGNSEDKSNSSDVPESESVHDFKEKERFNGHKGT